MKICLITIFFKIRCKSNIEAADNGEIFCIVGSKNWKNGNSERSYLSLTNLSKKGLRGRRFIISDSASSYAKEMAGT